VAGDEAIAIYNSLTQEENVRFQEDEENEK
jgi:hypothetical protein